MIELTMIFQVESLGEEKELNNFLNDSGYSFATVSRTEYSDNGEIFSEEAFS